MKLVTKQIPPVLPTQAATRLHHPPPVSVSAVVIVVFSLLLLGCGLTLNPTGGSQPGQSGSGSGGTGGTGAPEGPGEPQGQTIPLPGAFQALTGCENPNTGVASDDWGVGTDPAYTVIDNTAPVVGKPIYSSNAVFWTSRENAPGQSILLTGAFTDATKTVRLALIP